MTFTRFIPFNVYDLPRSSFFTWSFMNLEFPSTRSYSPLFRIDCMGFSFHPYTQGTAHSYHLWLLIISLLQISPSAKLAIGTNVKQCTCFPWSCCPQAKICMPSLPKNILLLSAVIPQWFGSIISKFALVSCHKATVFISLIIVSSCCIEFGFSHSFLVS
jgi:hypothetical protein